MRLRANGRYAVAAMIDLARAPEGQTTTLRMIAERQSISLSYLEQIFIKLRRRGIVRSYKGPGGGYRLSRSVQSINIAEILEAVGGSLNATKCGGTGNCLHGKKCSSHDLWSALNLQVEEFLSNVSLMSLVQQAENAQQHDKIVADSDALIQARAS